MEIPKNITIFSTSINHLLYIKVLLRVFQSYRITLVVHQVFLQVFQREISGFENSINLVPFTGKHPYTSENKRIVDHADLVIFDEMFTLPELVAFSRWKLRPNMYLTVHNCNSWFFPKYSLHPRQNAVSALRSIIRKNVSNVIVMGSALKEYLEERGVRQRILFVPDYCPDLTLHFPEVASSAGMLRVVVPGTVSSRRDYEIILEAACRKELRDMITLVLLGAPTDEYGFQIINRCRNLRDDGYDITWFESFVPQEAFISELGRADVLLSAFDVRYITIDRQVEIYGTTKVTALAYLSLAYAKPVILPAEYRTPIEIETQLIPFRSVSDLSLILERMAGNASYRLSYTKAAQRNAKNFSLEQTRNQFRELLCL